MTEEERFSSFFSRVEFEREVLRLVNSSPLIKTALHGLSPQARMIWAKALTPTIDTLPILDLLEQCADVLGGMADHSRNVFETRPAGLVRQKQLLQLIQGLLYPPAPQTL